MEGTGNGLTVTVRLPFIVMMFVLHGAAATAVMVKECVPTEFTAEAGIAIASALPVPVVVAIV